MERGPVCDLLGCAVPVVLAGMGGVARSELVSAVTAAGGFGFLGMVREPVALIEAEVGRVRAAGHEAFGINIIPAATEAGLLGRQVDAIVALEVPAVALFWDIDARVVARLRDAGIVVAYQVGSVEEAVTAERAGAQIIIAQGMEAGGHVRGIAPLRELLPAVARAVRAPVLAAGGLATGADFVTAMGLGADGVVLGTALMATEESFAHPYHQQRLVEAAAADTVLTGTFHINWPPGAPVRVLRSPVTALRPEAAGRQVIGEEEGRPIYLFSTDSPLRSMTGDFASMALYAGTGVGAITAIEPAGKRIGRLLAEADAAMPAPGPALHQPSSSVCYAGEMSGDYMGHASAEEVAQALSTIAADLMEILRLTLAVAAGADAPLSRPPFDPEASTVAGWVLALRGLCAEAGVSALDYNFALPPAGDVVLERRRLELLVRQRLAELLPRMAEDRTRQVLSGLGRFMAKREPSISVPPAHSGESLAASAP